MLDRLTIKRLMISASACLLITLGMLFAWSNQLLSVVDRTAGANRELVRAMLLAKEARFQVIQIQQFLTDAGATAEEAPFGEAKKALENANANLDKLAKEAPELATVAAEIKPRVFRLHEIGVRMARAYIDQGRDAGNAIMKRPGDGLDDLSAAIAERIDDTVRRLEGQLGDSTLEVTSAIQRTKRLVLISGIGLMLFTLSVMVVLYRTIIPPLRALRNSMVDIGEGQGDLTVRIQVHGRNEIADVARSFNVFVGRIREMIQKIARDSEKLAATSDTLSKASDSTLQGMRKLKAESEAATESVEQLSSAVREVANHAETAARSARSSDEEAERGREVVQGTINVIRDLATGVRAASGSIHALEEQVAEVSQTVGLIREIAGQTNLLALNAAIEAARAGEQGRGFAVVADEVRKLAQRTHESTQRIEEVIARLQQGTREAVEAMERGREEAEGSAAKTAAAEEALSNILGALGQIKEMTGQIARSADTQKVAAERIGGSISAILEVSDDTAREAHRTSQQTAEMGTLMQQLSSLVQQFRIGNDRTLDLSRAKTAHLAWKSRLRAFLDGSATLSEEQAVSHRHCDFGRWYYSPEGLARYPEVPELREVETPHAELHQCIAEIIRAKNSGDLAAAEAAYASVDGLSGRIVALLDSAEKRAGATTA